MRIAKPTNTLIATGAVLALAGGFGLSALIDTPRPAVAQGAPAPQTAGLPPGSVTPWKSDGRPYHMGIDPVDGAQYKLYDTCAFPHEYLRGVRVPMAIHQLQKNLQCEGEELSATSVTGIRQKVLRFEGKDPQDTFVAVVQNRRVMHIQRGM